MPDPEPEKKPGPEPGKKPEESSSTKKAFSIAYELSKEAFFTLFPKSNYESTVYYYVTIIIIILVLLILFGWIYDRLDLQQRSCNKLKMFYKSNIGRSYFVTMNSVVASTSAPTNTNKFDISNSILKNYYVKSAYNCCCGDGYKNNFVNLCALEKCISNGCRFLDFQVFSYNNVPIIASSTTNNNYIKETYNSLTLEEILTTITSKAFDAVYTNCNRDPLILNFRIMSTNLTMLEKMGELFETHLDTGSEGVDSFRLMKQHNYKNGTILSVQMKDLYKTIIIICDFYPSNSILERTPELATLATYISLKGKSDFCKTYRHSEIVGKTTQFFSETKRNFVIVLPDLNNSIYNDEYASSFSYGCNAIAMKYQTKDNNLTQYITQFTNEDNYSWILKRNHLISEVPTNFAIIPFTSHNTVVGTELRTTIQNLLAGG